MKRSSVRTASLLTTPDALKARMLRERAGGNTRYGTDGELILAEYLRDLGHSVAWVHAAGIDLSVDGDLNVDVKAHLALGKPATFSPPQVSPRLRIEGVHYTRVVFLDDAIRIFDAPFAEAGEEAVIVDWEVACGYLARSQRGEIPSRADPAGTRASQKQICKALAKWVSTTWRLRAYVIFRGNSLTQASMSRRGWGPESFYQDPAKAQGKFDVVVLIYFEESTPQSIYAYPLSRSDDIAWISKPVGPNRAGRMSFDPKLLDNRFVFSSLDNFKEEFPLRFI